MEPLAVGQITLLILFLCFIFLWGIVNVLRGENTLKKFVNGFLSVLAIFAMGAIVVFILLAISNSLGISICRIEGLGCTN